MLSWQGPIKEFCDDVVAVTRKGHASLTQTAKDFGVSLGALSDWVSGADIKDGKRPGMSTDNREEMRVDCDHSSGLMTP